MDQSPARQGGAPKALSRPPSDAGVRDAPPDSTDPLVAKPVMLPWHSARQRAGEHLLVTGRAAVIERNSAGTSMRRSFAAVQAEDLLLGGGSSGSPRTRRWGSPSPRSLRSATSAPDAVVADEVSYCTRRPRTAALPMTLGEETLARVQSGRR